VASNYYSSRDECPTNLWILPTFSDLANMTREDLTSPVTAAATAQVKLCPYDEEEPHIWFRLIKAQFAAAVIKSQKLKYANAFASLPKQVLQDILDTLDFCSNSDEPFDFLKNTLLGQFGKGKWQSCFELPCLPMEMQGLKPSVLMGKLKQHLSPRVSPDNDHFRSFSCNVFDPSSAINERDSRSWRPWNGRSHGEGCGRPIGHGGHDPTVAAASTQRSRSPTPSSGKRGDKRGGNARPKSCPPSCLDFHSFQNPGNGMCKFYNYYANRANRGIPPCSWSEN
jgi:hypothetical protein